MLPLERKLILFRWVCALLLVIGGLIGIYYMVPQNLEVQLPPMKNYKRTVLKIPPPSERAILKRAVSIVKGLRESQVKTNTLVTYQDLKPSLFYIQRQKMGQQKTSLLTVSLIFLGQGERYAIINGSIYKQGDMLPDGRQVLSISDRGILIRARDNVYLVPWKGTGYVRLERSSSPTNTGGNEKKTSETTKSGKEELKIIKKILESKSSHILEKSKLSSNGEK